MQVKMMPAKSVNKMEPTQRSLGRLIEISIDREEDQQALDLLADSFWQLYTKVDLKDNPPPERVINHLLMKWVVSNSEFETTKAYTDGNIMVSLASARLLWEALLTDEAIQEALKKQQEAEELLQQAEQDKLVADALENEDDELAQQYAESAEANQDQAIQLLREAQEQVSSDWVNAVVVSAVSEAREKGDEVRSFANAWGIGPGEIKNIDFSKIQEALGWMNMESIRRISEWIGRLKGFVQSAKSQRVHRGYVPVNVTQTQDIMRIFPGELALLRKDVPDNIRAQQIAKYAEHGLLGWSLESNPEKRGPFVALVDISGSMDGDRNIIAKAIVLSLAKVARDEGRSYRLILFGDEIDPNDVVTDKDSWLDHVEWASLLYGGGTSFDKAFDVGLQYIENNTDLLIITDAICDMSPDIFLRVSNARDNGMKLYSVIVDSDPGVLKRVSDKVLVTNLKNPQEIILELI